MLWATLERGGRAVPVLIGFPPASPPPQGHRWGFGSFAAHLYATYQLDTSSDHGHGCPVSGGYLDISMKIHFVKYCFRHLWASPDLLSEGDWLKSQIRRLSQGLCYLGDTGFQGGECLESFNEIVLDNHPQLFH